MQILIFLFILSFAIGLMAAVKYSLHGVTIKALYISSAFFILASFFLGLSLIGKTIQISNFLYVFGIGSCLSIFYLISGIVFLKLGDKFFK
jgi:hypothetical protein